MIIYHSWWDRGHGDDEIGNFWAQKGGHVFS